MWEGDIMWEPPDSDLNWISDLLTLIPDGGMWKVPLMDTLFKIWHSTMTAMQMSGRREDEMNLRIVICLEMLGYEVSYLNEVN